MWSAIRRTQGHLLFSEWTISQRTLSVEAEASFRSCSVVQAPLVRVTLSERDGKSSALFDTCKRLLKNPFSTTLPSPKITLPCRGRFKERFPKAAAKVRGFSSSPNNRARFF